MLRRPIRYDLHAPDLYIPSMAFVTYVLVSAFALGTSGKFNPEVIFTTGWSCIGLLVLELMIIKVAMGSEVIRAKPYAFHTRFPWKTNSGA